ncbi:MAG TPA: thioredoxin fold domain-containing protein [Flavipsychrobacter sp.]|nr:thioredoxin fold domain-containing protein [Flavipsychrobacter sp.]
MKQTFVIAWLGLILAGMSYLFWQNELKYTLPTPVPQKYAPVKTGEIVGLKTGVTRDANRPLFIHFYNPNCPCSKFNIPHVRSLMKKYGDRISFAVVVLSNQKFTETEIKDKFGGDVPVYFDKEIANACGVYSTPQAVLLNEDNRLYYRGNYNKSRYCTDKNSNYAQQALDSFLAHNSKPIFNHFALKAYGCELPDCRK